MFNTWTLGDTAYKPGVWGTPSSAIQSAIDAASQIWSSIGSSLTVTSLQDGSHAAGPCGHSAGNAVDLRTKDLTPAQQQQAYAQLQQQLPGYLVLWESDHIHVQTTGSLCAGGAVPDIPDPTATDGQASSFDLSSFVSGLVSDPTSLLLVGLGLFLLLRR